MYSDKILFTSLNSKHKSGKPYKQGVPGLFFLLCYYFATNRNYSISHRFVFQIAFLFGIGITFPDAVSFDIGPYGSPVSAYAVS